MARVFITISYGGGHYWRTHRQLDITELAKTNDTIVSQVLAPAMKALDEAAAAAGVPVAEWRES